MRTVKKVTVQRFCIGKKAPCPESRLHRYQGKLLRKNFTSNKKKLELWLSKNKNFIQDGEAYGVYWNGPFVPGFFKRSEVHIPVKIKTASK